MGSSKKVNTKKADHIREMLLNTVSKNPDLFSYYVNIQEAKDLLGQQNFSERKEIHLKCALRKIIEC